LRFLILTNDYPEFLDWLYEQNPGLAHSPFEQQLQIRNESMFGGADFQSSALRALGHEAWDVYANNTSMQTAWARTHSIATPHLDRASRRRRIRDRGRRVADRFLGSSRLRSLVASVASRIGDPLAANYAHVREQINYYRPDVVIVQAVDTINVSFLREMKATAGVAIVGFHASPPLPADDYSVYDLVASSFPPTVDFFRHSGVQSIYLPLAFDARVLQEVGSPSRDIAVSFVGGFGKLHTSRTAFLEDVAAHVPDFQVWGWMPPAFPKSSPLHRCYAGPAWGRDMYEVLARSRISLNHHGDFPPYANNSRLFEATGCGACLVTDWKENLHVLFEPDRDVLAYRSHDEAIGMIHQQLQNDSTRLAIATSGQARTLTEHTMLERQRHFLEQMERLGLPSRAG
jgi:hypothetical protein